MFSTPRHLLVPFLPATLLLLSSCGGGGGSSTASTPPPSPPISKATGLLVPVTTAEQLLSSVKAGFERELSNNREAIANDLTLNGGSPQPESNTGQFTTTYTQETSVDEHDSVKYDGQHLYIAPSRSMECCFLTELALGTPGPNELVAPEPESGARAIRILATDTEAATVSAVSSIAVSEQKTVEGLYIDSGKLAAISTTAWWGYYGPQYERIENWAEQSSSLQIYDVSVAELPTLSWELEIEGGFVNSRKVGNTIYLISRFSPSIEGLDYYPSSDLEATANSELIDAVSMADILPKVRINGQPSSQLRAEDCLVTDPEHDSAGTSAGYPVLTTIVAIDLDNPAITDTLCYNDATSGTYVAANAIYLTQSDYDSGTTEQTIVHRIAYKDGLQYSGSGKVLGNLGTGGNLDFRISESQDYLRLLTTVWTGNETDRLEHYLHVLTPAKDAPELAAIASLPNEAHPSPIGKPNEDLYGVRFFKERAFLVTFEQIDPLYVLDLSDHENPQIAGELEITGFSDFLHPVSDTLLLGLGQDMGGLVKLELFDISDPSTPESLAILSLAQGAQWSYSDARYNRHAFTYLADVDGVDRFAIPVGASFTSESEGAMWEDRLYLLEIRGKADPGNASIANTGYITATPAPNEYRGSSRHRSILHGDAVYYLNGDHIWSALWTNPFNQQGPH